MKVLLPLRVFLIVSILWLTAFSTHAFFQNATSKAKIKTKYEFTDTRISEADTLLKKREYAPALEAYQKAYDIYEAEKFYEGMVYAKERMGHTQRRLKQDSLSRELFSDAASLSRKLLGENHVLESKAYLNNSIRAHFANYSIEASRLVDSAMWVYKKSTLYDSTLLDRIIQYKFYTYYYSNISNDTLIKYVNERAGFLGTKASLSQTAAFLLDYTRSYYRSGDFDKSVAYGLEAVKTGEANLKELGKRFYSDALFNLGRSLVAKGNYEEALSISSKLVDFNAEASLEDPNYTSYLNLKAVSFNSLKRYDEAAKQFMEILKILKEQNIQNDFYRDIFMNLGLCYYRMGRKSEGLKKLEKALEYHKSDIKLYDASFTNRYRYLAEFFYSEKNYDKALLYYDSALMNSVLGYSDQFFISGQSDKSEIDYETLSILKNKQLTVEQVFLKNKRDSLEQLEWMISSTMDIHGALLSNRESFQASEGKLFLSEDFKELYESGLNASYILSKESNETSEYVSIALGFMSLSKANLFLEQSGELGKVQDERLPLKTKLNFFSKKAKIDSLEQLFYKYFGNIVSSDSIRDINSELLRLNGELALLKSEISKIVGETTSDLSTFETYLSEAQAKLKLEKESVLLEYFVGDRYIFIIGFNSQKSVFKRVKRESNFQDDFNDFLNLVSQRPSVNSYRDEKNEYKQKSNFLYSILLEDILTDLSEEGSNITIIPDEELSRLPFDALLLDTNIGNGFNDFDYLVRHYNFNYSLSLNQYLSNPINRKSKKDLLAVGFSGSLLSETRSNSGALPGTEEEVLFLKERFSGDFLTGNDASKEEFLRKAGDYDILHLAIHGESGGLDRYQSSLIFNGKENNILKTSDLYVADLKARLAILSACESGTGLINRGEGTFSIARGFALVGVPSVVMSLWKVNDEFTAEIVVNFYEGLIEGLDKAEALRVAKLSYLKNADNITSHPRYWSGLVLLGDTEPIDLKVRNATFNYWFFLLLLLVTIGILFTVHNIKSKYRGHQSRP